MQFLLPFDVHEHVSALQKASKRADTRMFIVIFITALLAVPLFVLGGANIGYGMIVAGVAVTIGVAMIAFWPVLGLFVVVGCVVLVEQEPLTYSTGTDRLTIFYWPPRLAGLIERPIGFLMLFVFLVIICRYLLARKWLLRGGAMLGPFLFFLACVVLGIAHGLTSGGQLKIVVVEVRPLWYMFLSYLLAYNLVTSKVHVRTMFWLVIIGAAVKGIQGVYIYFVDLHGNLLGHREIMAHEESFFFAALLLLIIIYCLHHKHVGQLIAALLATPCVVIAMVANQRRTDYIALLVGIGVAWLLIFLCKPEARKMLVAAALICTLLLSGYVAAFYRTSGGFGAPARSIISVFYPTAEDASSNAYRVIENFDLKFTVKQNLPLGLGFGKPFSQPVLLPNILIEDPYYNYVPHNTIYWIWMRLGPLGYLALWYLFGSMIVRGSIITRQIRDPYLQMTGIYIVAITVMEVIVAYADYQLYFYRNVIYLGILIGVLMKLPDLDRTPEERAQLAREQQQSASVTKREFIHASSDHSAQPATPGRWR